MTFELSSKNIAEVCHEANRALQHIFGENNPSFTWHFESKLIRDSALFGVRLAIEGKTPEELHEAWVQYKVNEGWVYGPEKSEAAMTHPLLVGYDELPPEQKLKDKVFQAIVLAMRDDLSVNDDWADEEPGDDGDDE